MKLISIILSAVISVTLLTGCEKAESVAEGTTVSETTAATIPADLTEEEMAIWESMPDIVTMRIRDKYKSETSEIVYIEKNGAIKTFLSDEYYQDKENPEWILKKINNNKADVIGYADIHKLINLYTNLLSIDIKSQMAERQVIKQQKSVNIVSGYEIYGFFNKNENILFSYGYTGTEYVRDDPHGNELLILYLEIDPFLILLF